MAKLPMAETIMEQGVITTEYWLKQAIKSIDNCLGEGYAKEHPELIGQFIQTAALDQAGMYLRGIAERLNEMDLSVNVEFATDNISDGLSEIANAIDDVAENMKR